MSSHCHRGCPPTPRHRLVGVLSLSSIQVCHLRIVGKWEGRGTWRGRGRGRGHRQGMSHGFVVTPALHPCHWGRVGIASSLLGSCRCRVLIVEVTSCNSLRLCWHCIPGLVVVTSALRPRCCHGHVLQVTKVTSASALHPHYQSHKVAWGEDEGESRHTRSLSSLHEVGH